MHEGRHISAKSNVTEMHEGMYTEGIPTSGHTSGIHSWNFPKKKAPTARPTTQLLAKYTPKHIKKDKEKLYIENMAIKDT